MKLTRAASMPTGSCETSRLIARYSGNPVGCGSPRIFPTNWNFELSPYPPTHGSIVRP